jgi:hypothetical protein
MTIHDVWNVWGPPTIQNLRLFAKTTRQTVSPEMRCVADVAPVLGPLKVLIYLGAISEARNLSELAIKAAVELLPTSCFELWIDPRKVE